MICTKSNLKSEISRDSASRLEATLSRTISATFLAVFVALTAAGAEKQPAASDLTVVIDGAHVNVANATPGGKVVFLGIGRFVKGYRVTVRRFDKTVSDDDQNGKVVLDIGEKIPWKTIFVAIDYTSGRFAIATPDGFPLLPIQFKKDFMVANNGQLDHLVFEHRFLDMLLVRPGVGVWGQLLGDGNKFDEGSKGDGKVVGNVARSVPLGGDVPAPKKFDKGDVLVLIDSLHMQAYAVEVGSK